MGPRPSGDSKLPTNRGTVKLKVLGVRDSDCLFEPALRVLHVILHAKGLSMADAVVEVGDGNAVNLVVANRSTEPVLLQEGEVLGEIQPATLMEHIDDDQPDIPRVAAITRENGYSGGEKELWAALDLDTAYLCVTKCELLHLLVMEFSDVFALNSLDLGRTSDHHAQDQHGRHSPPYDNHHAVCHSPCWEKWIH